MKDIFRQIKRFSDIDFKEGKPFKFTLDRKENNNTDWLCPPIQKMEVGKSYEIEVKKYMTEPATANFDFQDKWNNGVPMPFQRMKGKVTKETRGMFQMELEVDNASCWHGWVIKSAIKEWKEIKL